MLTDLDASGGSETLRILQAGLRRPRRSISHQHIGRLRRTVRMKMLGDSRKGVFFILIVVLLLLIASILLYVNDIKGSGTFIGDHLRPNADSWRRRLRLRNSTDTIETTTLMGNINCRLIVFDVTYMDPNGTVYKNEETSCIPVVDGVEGDETYPISVPDHVKQLHAKSLEQGDLYMTISEASVVPDKVHVTATSKFAAVPSAKMLKQGQNRHRELTSNSFGVKTLGIMRISTSDSSLDYSASQLSSTIFDPNNYNVKSQYWSCSFGQLQLAPAGVGVLDVYVGQSVKSFSSYEALINAALQQVKSQRGITSVASLADRFIVCLPPGTGAWTASAGMNYWRAQFNNAWCLSLTANMHELGHTFGLPHSGKNGIEYTDWSDYMSSGFSDQHGPLRCFNGYSSWMLGWYQSRALTVNPQSQGAQLYNLATFVDYQSTSSSQNVLINIGNTFYLIYNRAKGMNSGTGTYANMVTIASPISFGSNMLAGLDVNQRYQSSNYQGSGYDLIIHVCSHDTSVPESMILSIGLGTTACAPPPTPRPTESPTPYPTFSPTTPYPTYSPTTWYPTFAPTTWWPTYSPTRRPTKRPTRHPTSRPTKWPTPSPTHRPTKWPTPDPTERPSPKPSPRTTSQPTMPRGRTNRDVPFIPTSSPTANTVLSPDRAPAPTQVPIGRRRTRSPAHREKILRTPAPTQYPTISPTYPTHSLVQQYWITNILPKKTDQDP